jgi:hypothetical protein
MHSKENLFFFYGKETKRDPEGILNYYFS